MKAILRHGGVLYWVTWSAMQRLNNDGSISTLYSDNGNGIVRSEAVSLLPIAGNLILVPQDGLCPVVAHQIATGTNKTSSAIQNLLQTHFYDDPIRVATDGTSLYVAAGGIFKVPTDLNVKVPQTINSYQASVKNLLVEGGWLYWSGRTSGVSQIVRMKTDGSGYQVLSTGLHKDLLFYNDRLYFTCNNCTTVPGWVIASIPKEGGQVVPEVGLGLEPGKLVRKGDIFYITDRLQGTPYLLFALNMPLEQAAVVGEAGRPDYDLNVSDKYVYAITPSWTMRFKIRAWDSYSSSQILPISSNAIHFSGNSLYWWDSTKGLQKVDE